MVKNRGKEIKRKKERKKAATEVKEGKSGTRISLEYLKRKIEKRK